MREKSVPDLRPRCAACDDVIGVYEPLVHVAGGYARSTSRAAEPDVPCSEDECYHESCFEGLEDLT